MRHAHEAKIVTPVPWSPLQDIDLDGVPTDARDPREQPLHGGHGVAVPGRPAGLPGQGGHAVRRRTLGCQKREGTGIIELEAAFQPVLRHPPHDRGDPVAAGGQPQGGDLDAGQRPPARRLGAGDLAARRSRRARPVGEPPAAQRGLVARSTELSARSVSARGPRRRAARAWPTSSSWSRATGTIATRGDAFPLTSYRDDGGRSALAPPFRRGCGGCAAPRWRSRSPSCWPLSSASSSWAAGPTAGLISVVVVLRWCGAGFSWFVRRRFRAWRYQERNEDLLVARGVMVQRLSVVPYGRMQFVEVTAGPDRAALPAVDGQAAHGGRSQRRPHPRARDRRGGAAPGPADRAGRVHGGGHVTDATSRREPAAGPTRSGNGSTRSRPLARIGRLVAGPRAPRSSSRPCTPRRRTGRPRPTTSSSSRCSPPSTATSTGW